VSPVARAVLGGILGAAVGYAFYKIVGCRTGTCPLSANPYIAMLIWGMTGVLLSISK
jgi:hypothetical protein